MTRLESLLNGDRESIRHSDDVAALKQEIAELRVVSDGVVQMLYEDWSEAYWAAGWLILDSGIVTEFAAYLREEVNEKSDEDEQEKFS